MHDTAFPTIRFANFLSPKLESTYRYIADYVGAMLGYSSVLSVGQSLEEFADGRAAIGFLCGLLYVHSVDGPNSPLELLAAPVISGERYQGKPLYFSDVLVRQDSPYLSFDDLTDCVWAYNEQTSHSGYNLVYYSLLRQGKAASYFGSTLKTGSHFNSLQMIIDGHADATAIDSHVLDVILRTEKDLASKVRVISMLGPSTIPPIVVAKSMNADLKCKIQNVFVTMHRDSQAVKRLQEGCIERFVPISDEHYQDVRQMFAQVQAWHSPSSESSPLLEALCSSRTVSANL